MGDNKLKAKINASPSTDNDLFAKELEEELMKHTQPMENGVDWQSVEQTEKTQDVEVVDKVDCPKPAITCGHMTVESEGKDMDLTESWGSFGGSNCEVDNVYAFGESEALSSDGEKAFEQDMLAERVKKRFLRRRKLKNPWRRQIHPFLWHCKCTESQIKKLKEQAQLYEKKLEENRRKKQVDIDKATLEVSGLKSLPLPRYYRESKIYKRKRRRYEATKDPAAYMWNHNLFSYYESGKKSSVKAPVNVSSSKNPAERTAKPISNDVDYHDFDEQPYAIGRGNDDIALENLYRKLSLLQTHVGELKSRANKLMNEHAITEVPPIENSMLPAAPHNALAMPPPDTNDRMTPQPTQSQNMDSKAELEGALVGGRAEVVPCASRSTDDDNVLVYSRRDKANRKLPDGENFQLVQKSGGQSINNSPGTAAQSKSKN
ncbi:uncharacterized protein LOC127252675 [Andrographis paniculata]|uniref:uncharacterized protein LOC127252675 n=1 Tax=Andrographis paniculata TaxID=175694 RepID=UPI0021E793A5|nr:uncharacterized protein LOC127252675 [Andrographis paniculata]